MPQRTYPVQRLYVKPNMKIIHPRYRHGQTVRSGAPAPRETVDTLNDVLYSGDATVVSVYITGDAGAGKSTLCEQMVSLWCQTKTASGHAMSADERALSRFTLLFFISLRESVARRPHSDDDSIEEMIKIQLGVFRYDIRRMLQEEKCLVILDGLDEWTPLSDRIPTRFHSKHLPRSPPFGNFTIVTTSRPWKLEVLRSEVEGRMDKHIEITGLGQKAVYDLVSKVLGILNEEDQANGKTADAFLETIRKKDVDLKRLIETPVLLLQLVCLWFDGRPLEDSLVELYSNMVDRQLLLAQSRPDMATPATDTGNAARTKHPVDMLNSHLQANSTCRKYATLLVALAELAYSAFFSTCRETALVFDHRETEVHGMSGADVERCLRIGLLSQNMVPGKITEENKRISFVHKTFQEYFAAVYITSQAPIVGVEKLFPKDRLTMEFVLEMEKVFVFVCGMNSGVGESLLGYVLGHLSQNEAIKAYRASIEKELNAVTGSEVRIQSMVLGCLQEASNNGFDMQLPLDDIRVSRDLDIDIVSKLAAVWDKVDTSHLKSIYIVTPSVSSYPAEREDIARIFAATLKTHALERIHIFDWLNCIKPSILFDAINLAKKSLKSLALLNVQLYLLEKKMCEVLKALSLEAFGLEGYGHGWANPMTHGQLSDLSSIVSSNVDLKRLRLEEIYCTMHVDCQFDLKLCLRQRLWELYLDNVYVNTVDVNVTDLRVCELRQLPVQGAVRALLQSLRGATQLRRLVIMGFIEMADVEALMGTLPHLVSLKTLRFGGKAKYREAIGEQFDIRLPPTLTDIESVHIKAMSLTNSCLRQFVDSLSSRKLEVRLSSITGAEESLNYIRDSPKFTILQDGEQGGIHFRLSQGKDALSKR